MGRDAGARHIILTHFSQRYPGLPKVENEGKGCVVAWDWMRVTPSNIEGAKGGLYKRLMPHFEEEGSGGPLESDLMMGGESVSDVMKEPGGFAKVAKEVCTK